MLCVRMEKSFVALMADTSLLPSMYTCMKLKLQKYFPRHRLISKFLSWCEALRVTAIDDDILRQIHRTLINASLTIVLEAVVARPPHSVARSRRLLSTPHRNIFCLAQHSDKVFFSPLEAAKLFNPSLLIALLAVDSVSITMETETCSSTKQLHIL